MFVAYIGKHALCQYADMLPIWQGDWFWDEINAISGKSGDS